MKLKAKKERLINHLFKQRDYIRKEYDPERDRNIINSDPRKTIFIGRLNYETNEQTIKRSFENYGDIKRVRLIKNKEGKSRGYAFLEFKDTSGAKLAYDKADGKRIDGVHILVDWELARIDKKWLPRRLGGGKGGLTR